MIYRGISAAPGIVTGRAFVVKDAEFCAVKKNLLNEEIPKEIERFEKAVNGKTTSSDKKSN